MTVADVDWSVFGAGRTAGLLADLVEARSIELAEVTGFASRVAGLPRAEAADEVLGVVRSLVAAVLGTAAPTRSTRTARSAISASIR